MLRVLFLYNSNPNCIDGTTTSNDNTAGSNKYSTIKSTDNTTVDTGTTGGANGKNITAKFEGSDPIVTEERSANLTSLHT